MSAPLAVAMPRLAWPLVNPGRVSVAVGAAAVGALVTIGLPASIRVAISYDLAAMTYLVMFFIVVSVTNTEQAVSLLSREPGGRFVVVAALLLSLVSMAAVAAALNVPGQKIPWLSIASMLATLVAIFISWILAHVFFGLHYMRSYYAVRDGLPAPDGPVLDFPQQSQPDTWDFMYYSFTIAMCYQTADVTINGSLARRLTLVHAVLSFFYVALILGLVVNVMSALL